MGRYQNPPQLRTATVAQGNDSSAAVNTDFINAIDSTNWIVNSTGALGSAGWPTLVSSSGPGVYGEGYFFWFPQANNQTLVNESNKYAIMPGETLYLSGELYAAGVTAGSLNMDIAFYDSAGNNISYNNAQVTAPNGSMWTRYESDTVAPNSAASFTLRVYLQGATSTNAAYRQLRVSTKPGPWGSNPQDLNFLSGKIAANETTSATANTNAINAFNTANSAIAAVSGKVADVRLGSYWHWGWGGGATGWGEMGGYVVTSYIYQDYGLGSGGSRPLQKNVNGTWYTVGSL